MECENEACDECKRNCQLIHGKRDSFFKMMIGKEFSKIMFLPPRFARLNSNLTNRKTYLEDSSGQQWRVTVCNHSGSLAIQEGWPIFCSEHGLGVGDLLVFHYVQGQHFIVQIFGHTGCEKITHPSDICKGQKRARTYPEATSQDELLQTTDISSTNKKSKTYSASESEKVTHQSHITKFAPNIDANSGKGKLVHPAVNVDESFCMIDRDGQCDQGDDRLCLHLSSFEMPASKPLAERTDSLLKGDNGSSNHVEANLRIQAEELSPTFDSEILRNDKIIGRPVEDIPPLSQKDENDRSTNVMSSSFLKPAENSSRSDDLSNINKHQNPRMSTFESGSHVVLRSNNEQGLCTGSHQITRRKSKEASQFTKKSSLIKKELVETATEVDCPAKRRRLVKKEELVETAIEADCPPKKIRLVKKEPREAATEAYCPARALSDSGKEPRNGKDKVIKSEPADSGETPSLISYSFLQEVDGRDFLQLPESWRKYLKKRAKMGRWIIYLRGPDKRPWATFYRSRSGKEVLTHGWKNFTAAYDLKPGDQCLFQLENQLECTFNVQVQK